MRLAALLLAAAALPVSASNVYKWTDAQGQVHYTQTPPRSGSYSSQSQRSLQPGASTASPAPQPKPVEAAKTASAATGESADNKAKRCAAAKERQAFLASTIPRRLMVTGPDGQPARMTEEQYAEAVSKAQEAGKGC